MKHDDFRALIQRELDEELSDEEAKLLDAHVATCADCRLERADYQKLLNGFSMLNQLRPERSFVDQMLPDLTNFTTPPSVAPATKSARKRQAVWWSGLSVAAAVTLMFIGATHGSFWHGGQQNANVKVNSSQTALGQPQASQPSKSGGVAQGGKTATTSGTTGDRTASDQVAASAGAGTSGGQNLQQPSDGSSRPLIVADAVPSGGETLKQIALTPSSSSSSSNSPSGTKSVPAKTTSLPGTTEKQPSGATPPTQTTQPTTSSGIAQLQPPTQSVGAHAVGNGSVGTQSGLVAGIVPLHVVGPVQNPPADLNALLQADVQAGQATWATDPTEVVERNLSALGFSQTANVAATPDAGRVQVIQGGTTFVVTLTQPFAQGPEGIWVPVQIGRIVQLNQPEPDDQPIVQYFNEQQASGAILAVDQLEVVQNKNNQVTIRATLVPQKATDRTQAVTTTYLFSLAQKADGSYVLNGNPQVQ